MEKITTLQIITLTVAVPSAMWSTIQIFRFLSSRIKKSGEAFKLTLAISIINILGAVTIMRLAQKFNTFPRNFVFIFSVLMILTALSILVFAKGLINFLKSDSKENALDNKIKSLEKRDIEKTEEFAKKESDYLKRISDFEKEKTEKSHKDKLLSKYEFHPRIGFSKNKSNNLLYCTKCLNRDERESPLKEEPSGSGWSRTVCDEFYSNPDWQPPEVSAPDRPFY